MEEQCSVCLTEEIVDLCTTNCDHAYCKACLDSWFNRGNKSCPLCRQDIQYITNDEETYRVVLHRSSADTEGAGAGAEAGAEGDKAAAEGDKKEGDDKKPAEEKK